MARVDSVLDISRIIPFSIARRSPHLHIHRFPAEDPHPSARYRVAVRRHIPAPILCIGSGCLPCEPTSAPISRCVVSQSEGDVSVCLSSFLFESGNTWFVKKGCMRGERGQ